MRPDDPPDRVLGPMTEEDVNQFPVLDDSRCLGIVARDRVLNFIQTRAELGTGA